MEELRNNSYKLRELFEKPPKWILRSGSSTIAIGFVLLLLLSALISYNDILAANVIITSKNPPVKIKSRHNGELEDVYIIHGQKVAADQKLAAIKNPANADDIKLVKTKIDSIGNLGGVRLDSLAILYPNNLQLGSIQKSYNDFFLNYQEFILNDSLKPQENESRLLLEQIKQEKNLLSGRYIELSHFRKELELSQNAFDRSKTLFDKGVISKAEFENISRERLSDVQKWETLKSKIDESKIAITKLEQDSTIKQVSGIRTLGENMETLKQSIQTLKSDIELWEEKYLLKSPIQGTVNLLDTYHRYQNVEVGETLFTVFPTQTKGIIGTLKIPVLNSGKVKVGQKVIVKLDNYPYHQFGFLDGRVTGVSGAPNMDSSTYTVFIELVTQTTSHGHELDFNQELLGTAEIITEELSLLQRLLYVLRRTFSRDVQPQNKSWTSLHLH